MIGSMYPNNKILRCVILRMKWKPRINCQRLWEESMIRLRTSASQTTIKESLNLWNSEMSGSRASLFSPFFGRSRHYWKRNIETDTLNTSRRKFSRTWLQRTLMPSISLQEHRKQKVCQKHLQQIKLEILQRMNQTTRISTMMIRLLHLVEEWKNLYLVHLVW